MLGRLSPLDHLADEAGGETIDVGDVKVETERVLSRDEPSLHRAREVEAGPAGSADQGAKVVSMRGLEVEPEANEERLGHIEVVARQHGDEAFVHASVVAMVALERNRGLARLPPAMGQLALFGQGTAPAIDASFARLERIVLQHGAWVDVVRGWLSDDAAIFSLLRDRMAWRSERRVMYDRTVETPRQYAAIEDPGGVHPVLAQMRTALDARYRTSFERLSVAYYRDGRDSVAWHGDYVARRMHSALVATISVGAPRKFLLRPTGGGTSTGLTLGWGDLVVMGGTCQRTYQHAIPKVAQAAARIAIMFRPVWNEADADPPTDEQAPRTLA